MPFHPSTNLIDILELVGTLATLVALVFTVMSFRKGTKIQEAGFIQNLYDSFNRDRQAVLNNPQALKILAKERGISEEKFIKKSIAAFDINRAYHLYYLHTQNLIPDVRWNQDVRDLQRLFTDELVLNQWNQVRQVYPEDFRLFVDNVIIEAESAKT